MGVSNLRRVIKRYWVVITFPSFTAFCIYADWNHTRLWKKSLTEQEKLPLSN